MAAASPHVVHSRPANTGAMTDPRSSPTVRKLMVRARLRRAKLHTHAPSAPPPRRYAPLPRSSSALALLTPGEPGADTHTPAARALAAPRAGSTPHPPT